MGETAPERKMQSSATSIQDSSNRREKGRMVLILDNVCGTYVHGVFDKEGSG